MDILDLTNSSFAISIVFGALALVTISGAYQMYSTKMDVQALNKKALFRDGILGGIFTAMAWTLLPESMKSITDTLSSSIASNTASVIEMSKSLETTFDPELQIGPAKF